jgi:predicted nucleic acid-binding protein
LILIDSSVFVAYAVESDSNHEQAVKVIKQITDGDFGQVFTSDYVFDETTTVTLIRSKSIEKAIMVGNYIKDSVEIIKINEDLFEDSWEIFKSQKTKSTKLSFTDCSNVSIMKHRNIKNIATFDGEFKEIKSINVIR